MNMWVSLITSLLLTTLISFATPLVVIVLSLAILAVVSYFPLVDGFADQLAQQIWYFLMTFGEGSGTMGILVISVVASIAGFLFESLNFYRYQILVNHPHRWLTQPKSTELISSTENINL